jgi:hypothetical protein
MISTNYVFDISQYGIRDILVFVVSFVGLIMINTEEKVVITPHAREAYKCISDGDLERLRKHPLLV